MSKINISDYKIAFNIFLSSMGLEQVFYKNLQGDKVDYFDQTNNVHWLVMAFNWALVSCPGHQVEKEISPTRNNEMAWKSIDREWRLVIKDLEIGSK